MKLISLEFVTYWNVHILQWIGPFHVQERFMNCSWTMCIEMFLNSSSTLCLEMFMNFSWIGPFHVQEPFMNCSCVVHEFCAWTVHARFLNDLFTRVKYYSPDKVHWLRQIRLLRSQSAHTSMAASIKMQIHIN